MTTKKEGSGIKLSIIIPMYNTAKLTSELLEILKPQKTKEVEIILLNDGSTQDISEAIVSAQGFVEIYSLPNGGVSKARNKGLDVAKGEYITFIDSDDKVVDNYVKTILDKTKEEWDYCIMSWEATGKLKGKYIIDNMPPEWNTCVWNTIYKRTTIGNARFNETKTIAEDEDFNNRVRKGIKANITDVMYIYNSGREESLTTLYSQGKITRDLVKDDIIKCSLLLYQKSISEIGGVEKFISEFCEEFKDTYDITLVYSDCDRKQLSLLSKMVRCIKYNGQKFECDKYICVSNQANIANNVKSLDNFYADMIHADYEAMGWTYNQHPKTNIHIAVSEIAKKSFLKQKPNEKCEVIYNILKIKKPKKVLRIISAMRLGLGNEVINKEKGLDTMKIMAEKIMAKNPVVWNIFTDHPQTPTKGICYSSSQLDIESYIADCHFYVSCSPAESWGYSTAQALELGIPVVCMDYPAIHEQGLIDGVNGYIIKKDLSNLDDIIEKMIKNELKPPKYVKKDNPKQWVDLLGNIQKKSDYQYIKPDGTEVEVLKATFYTLENKQAEIGDTLFIQTEARLDYLVENGYVKII